MQKDGVGDVGTDSPLGRGVLEGAFALLDVMCVTGECGLTQLSATSGLPKATVYRLLQQLIELGAVDKSGVRYCVGPRIAWLGQAWRPDPAILRAVQGPMRTLAKATGASVGMGVPTYGQITMAHAVYGVLGRRVPMDPGTGLLSSTAAGRVLLAWNDPATAVVRSAAMRPDLAAEIRETGLALDRAEVLPGVHCAAVPLFGADSDIPVAVLSAVVDVSFPLPRLASALIRTSTAVSTALS
jgi:IclR family acetate operon transcriptional repressor